MTRVFCTSTSTATAGSTAESSSTTSTAAKNELPAPPKRSGISTPMRPSSNSLRISAGSMASFSSMADTLGAISLRAKSRTAC